mmetsp:Transcript_33441/g.75015  ORF Transcript_33441/g.75015 Transcript_33441/m.75015 type:complete len:228 (-) Transcript_33441:3-686(-)
MLHVKNGGCYLGHDGNGCISDCFIDANGCARVLLAEIVDHDEYGSAPHESLLDAEEDVGSSHRPPAVSVQDHEGHWQGNRPANHHCPLSSKNVRRDSDSEVENGLGDAEEDEVSRCQRELLRHKREDLCDLRAVTFHLQPSIGGVGVLSGRDRIHLEWGVVNLLLASRLTGNPRHGEGEELIAGSTAHDQPNGQHELERVLLDFCSHAQEANIKFLVFAESHCAKPA